MSARFGPFFQMERHTSPCPLRPQSLVCCGAARSAALLDIQRRRQATGTHVQRDEINPKA